MIDNNIDLNDNKYSEKHNYGEMIIDHVSKMANDPKYTNPNKQV
jgi:hypothetical protein